MKKKIPSSLSNFHSQYKLLNNILPKSPSHYRKRLREFFEWSWHTSEELNHKSVILDGTWPSSVEILEKALINAKKIREKTNVK